MHNGVEVNYYNIWVCISHILREFKTVHLIRESVCCFILGLGNPKC